MVNDLRIIGFCDLFFNERIFPSLSHYLFFNHRYDAHCPFNMLERCRGQDCRKSKQPWFLFVEYRFLCAVKNGRLSRRKTRRQGTGACSTTAPSYLCMVKDKSVPNRRKGEDATPGKDGNVNTSIIIEGNKEICIYRNKGCRRLCFADIRRNIQSILCRSTVSKKRAQVSPPLYGRG